MLRTELDQIWYRMTNTDGIDDPTLALLLLGLHEQNRAWKTFDWDTMHRLYANGMISNPVGKARSVVLTAEGITAARDLHARLFRQNVADSDRSAPRSCDSDDQG